MTRVFITGIAGFVGSWLARRLLNEGYEVHGADIISPSSAWRLRDIISRIKYHWQSIQDIRELPYEIVVHLSAQADVPFAFSSPNYTAQTNVLGTLNLLEVARKSKELKHFIHMSSESVYGKAQYLPIDEKHPLQPVNIYGATKAAGDILAQTYYRCFSVPVTVLRSGTLYGPTMRLKQVVSIFLKQALEGKPITVEGGTQTRDFNYIGNYIDFVLEVIKQPEKTIGEVYNVASGRETSILELAKLCIKVANSNSELSIKPFRPGEEGVRLALDISKAKSLGWAPKVDLEEGLAETYDWFKSIS